MPAPSEINLDGNVLQLYTYEQVDMDKKKAVRFATSLRDKVGAEFLPPVPMAGPAENVIIWLLYAQCHVCQYAGFKLTPQDFGAPPGFKAQQAHQGYTDYTGLQSPFGLESDIQVLPHPGHRVGAIPGM